MSKHTPAPWHDGDECGNIWHTGSDGRNRGVVLGCGDGLAINNDADRDLILAAPDMYEALQKIHGMLEAAGQDAHIMHAWASRALKKARGEV